jgi:hypothetical protein
MNRLMAATGRLVDRIKINQIERITRGDKVWWSKRRRGSARVLIPVANAFFRAAGNPVQILSAVEPWHAWEIECIGRLYGGGISTSTARQTLFVEELPGRSLSQYLEDGRLTPEMLSSAARELRRAHELPCSRFPDGWSHGDPHTGNVIFDAKTGRARLIDFEVQHDGHLSAATRHTDDLLVFLQDTLGRLSRLKWLELARVFVESYARPEITSHLVERLVAPRGIAKIWWAVRTTYLAPEEIAGRLHALRQSLV